MEVGPIIITALGSITTFASVHFGPKIKAYIDRSLKIIQENSEVTQKNNEVVDNLTIKLKQVATSLEIDIKKLEGAIDRLKVDLKTTELSFDNKIEVLQNGFKLIVSMRDTVAKLGGDVIHIDKEIQGIKIEIARHEKLHELEGELLRGIRKK